MKQKSLRTQVNYSKIGIDKNQLSVMSRENSRTFPKRGTALVTLNKVGEILYLTISPMTNTIYSTRSEHANHYITDDQHDMQHSK